MLCGLGNQNLWDNQTINGLAAQIDAARQDVGLASAMRLFVLSDLQAQIQSS